MTTGAIILVVKSIVRITAFIALKMNMEYNLRYILKFYNNEIMMSDDSYILTYLINVSRLHVSKQQPNHVLSLYLRQLMLGWL